MDAAKHVGYEINMLLYPGSLLGARWSSPPTTRMDADLNMALESFLLHFRNLRSFLCPSMQALYDDDIIASDFLGELTERDIGDRTAFNGEKKRLDQMLAHLSYKRDVFISGGESDWQVATLTILAIDQLDRFWDQLPARMIAWFPSRTDLRRQRTAAQDILVHLRSTG